MSARKSVTSATTSRFPSTVLQTTSYIEKHLFSLAKKEGFVADVSSGKIAWSCRGPTRQTTVHRSVVFRFSYYPSLLRPLLAFRPQSFRLRPEIEGFSHGLKKCPPDTFLPSLRSGRPFKSLHHHKRKNLIPKDEVSLLWRRRRDLNPRYPFGVYTISNRARSASYATSPCASALADLHILQHESLFVKR